MTGAFCFLNLLFLGMYASLIPASMHGRHLVFATGCSLICSSLFFLLFNLTKESQDSVLEKAANEHLHFSSPEHLHEILQELETNK